jgi:hypothetical protein
MQYLTLIRSYVALCTRGKIILSFGRQIDKRNILIKVKARKSNLLPLKT